MQINNFYTNLSMINRLNTYNKLAGDSLHRLSSGTKFLKDNPSDILKINKLNSQIRGSQAAQRNIQDGISFLQVKESAVDEMDSIAKRLKELSVQYNNGTMTNENKQNIEKESELLLKEMQRIKENTSFNGKSVFTNDKFIIQSGSNVEDKINLSTGDIVFSGLNSTKNEEVIKNVEKELNKNNINDFINSKNVSSAEITHINNEEIVKQVTKELNSSNVDNFVKDYNISSKTLTHNSTQEIVKNVTKELNSSNLNDFINSNGISTITQSKSDVENFDLRLNAELCTLIGYDVNFSFQKKSGTTDEYTVTGNIACLRAEGVAKLDRETKTFTIDFKYGCFLENADRYTFNGIKEVSDLQYSKSFTMANGSERSIFGIENYCETRESNRVSINDFKNKILHSNKDNTFNVVCSDGKNITITVKDRKATYQIQEKEVINTVRSMTVDELINTIKNPTKDDVINIVNPNGKNMAITVKDGKATYQTQEKEVTQDKCKMSVEEFTNEINNLSTSDNDIINIKYSNGENITVIVKDGKATYQTQEKETVDKQFDVSEILSGNYIDDKILKSINNVKFNIEIKTNELERKISLEEKITDVNSLALGKIQDVDMAKEMLNLVRTQSLVEMNIKLISMTEDMDKKYIMGLL